MRKLYAIVVALSVILLSCSKKNDSAPDPEPDPTAVAAAAKKLHADIQGKWTFGGVAVPLRVSPKGKTGTLFHPNNNTNTTARSQETGPIKTGFIEFLSDSTYIIYDSEEHYFTGKFEAKDGTTISLANLGTLSGIAFTQEKINFKLTYSSNNKSITVTANRAKDVPTGDKAKLLGRKWYLTHEEDGSKMFTEEVELYDDKGNVTGTFIPDSINFLMSSSGTYVVQMFDKGQLKSTEMANWKWHSSKTDRFVYWWYDMPVDEEQDFVIIRELTQDVFKASEYWIEDDGSVEMKWLLRPIR